MISWAILSIVIQFALSIAAWADLGRVFRASRAACAGVGDGCADGTLAFLAGGGMTTGEKEDRGNRWVLWAFSRIAVAMAFFPAYTDRNLLLDH